jgi:hypothetical protein
MTNYENALPTVYNGIQYRSRIEARWAAFFTVLNINFQYEPKRFRLGDIGSYLPDFYLPDWHTWVEIKSCDPEPIEIERILRLCKKTREHCLILGGRCDESVGIWFTSPRVGYKIYADCRFMPIHHWPDRRIFCTGSFFIAIPEKRYRFCGFCGCLLDMPADWRLDPLVDFDYYRQLIDEEEIESHLVFAWFEANRQINRWNQ